jgi:hypothetical protein
LYGLREIGTGYHGKEPGEYIVDTVRALVRLGTGDELGWESCLTTRPFTGRTFLPHRLGSAVFGRGEATGAERSRLDLADALAVLAEFSWRSEPVDAPGCGDPADGQVVVAGPLPAEDRWCPVADRLLHGEAWRHVVVLHRSGKEVLCLDPLAGGLTAFPAAEIAAVPAVRVLAPPVPPDLAALAGYCLRAGTAARTAAVGAAGRDTAGHTACADAAHRITAGGAAQRLRLSLQAQAVHALRWACLLGALPQRGDDELALADVLRDVLLGCRAAHEAATTGDAELLANRLLALASSARAIDELCARLPGPRVEEGALR